MYHLLWVNMVERDADHCENSNNTLFWDRIFFIVFDNISKTLVALFHDYAWKIILIFDKINNSHDHWVIKSSYAADFSFGCTNYLTFLIWIANTILESFSSISFSIDLRLDLKDSCLPSYFDYFDRVKVVVRSAKSCWIYQLKIFFISCKHLLSYSFYAGDCLFLLFFHLIYFSKMR